MTMLMTGASASYDGSGSPATATGPINVTFSADSRPTMRCYSRSDTAGYVVTFETDVPGRYRINLSSGDNYYFTVDVQNSSDTVDLSVVAV